MATFDDNGVGALEFTLAWEKDGVRHEDWFLGRKFNAVNDIFPRGMREALEGKGEGESVSLTYEPRMCIPRHRESQVLTLPLDRLRRKTVTGRPIVPRFGRFYPQGHIDGLLDIYPDTLTPFRLTGLTDTHFTADRNHPLARETVTFTVRIQYIEKRDTGTYGSLTHWREAVCDWGPGMQAMHDGVPTDFFQDGFFDRETKPGAAFAHPLPDANAIRNLETLMARHLKPGMKLLDFSRGDTPAGDYKGARCLFGVEYMDDPFGVFDAVATRLAPGDPVVIGFSNRYDPARVIDGWTQIHTFERPGLVLEYLRRAGLDADARTYSMRNDWRDRDDPEFLAMKGVSDPVFVVVGHKR